MNTMKSQEEVENFDILTGLPMRNTGQKMICTADAGTQWLSDLYGYG